MERGIEDYQLVQEILDGFMVLDVQGGMWQGGCVSVWKLGLEGGELRIVSRSVV